MTCNCQFNVKRGREKKLILTPLYIAHYFHQERHLLQRMHLPYEIVQHGIINPSLVAPYWQERKNPMALSFLSKHELCFCCKTNDVTDGI